jgi:hypothetical protein
MTSNYLRGGGFLTLLLPWSLMLQISYFAMGRVGVDEIGKWKARGGERIACNNC